MNNTIEKYREYVITSFVKSVQPIVIERAQGAIVTDDAGKEYVDCFAGISVVNAGHCNPEVVRAAKEQMDKLVHCCSYIYHNEPVANLAEKMAHITPGKLKKTFFANSGAEAIEGALKLAKLYTGKTEIIALETSFHGRTWGALSVTGNAGRKKRGGPYAPGIAFAPAPNSFRADAKDAEAFGERCAEALENILRFHTSGDVAAFLAEPVLGEGGIVVPPKNYFKAVKGF
jgi:4-aminobutyrate aminotransferase-like enzyme